MTSDDVLQRLKRYERFFQQADDLFFILDKEGRFVEINPKFAELLGYETSELLGRTSRMLVHNDDLERLREFFRDIKAGKTLRAEFRGVTKDGKTIWFEIVEWLSETGEIEGIARDITERKVAESRINHLNLVLRAIRNVNQLITRERNRHRLLQRACELLTENGYSKAWIALLDGKRVLRFYHSGLKAHEEEIRKIEKIKTIDELKCGQLAFKDGLAVIDNISECSDCPIFDKEERKRAIACRIEYAGRVYGVISVTVLEEFIHQVEEQELLREVSGDLAFALYSIELEEERKRAENMLVESEEKFRKMFELSPDFLAIVDKEGNFIEINPAMKSIGAEKGRNIFDVFPENIAEKRLEYLKSGKTVAFEDEIDGMYFFNTIAPVTLSGVERYLMISRDVTGYIRINRLLRTINRVNNLFVREKDKKSLLEKSCREISSLSNHYSVWIGLGEKEVEEISHQGLRSHPSILRVEEHPCHVEALNLRDAIRMYREKRKVKCPYYPSFENISCLVVPMVVDGTIKGFLDIHTTDKLPPGDEVELIKTLASDLAFAIRAIEIDNQRKLAFRQIDRNLEAMAILIDHIRNPLSVITGITELRVEDEEARKVISEMVAKIEETIKRLDRGWIESEEIRNFLRKSLEKG